MQKALICFCIGIATMLSISLPHACATSVYIKPDGTYCSYRKNETVDVIYVKENKLKGRTIPKGEAFIPKGTYTEIVLPYNLHSRHIETGDMITFKLQEDFLVNDVVIAPAGTNIWAEVLYSVGSWSYGHGGELDMFVKGFKTYNGVVVPLNLRIHKKNPNMNDAAIILGYGLVGGLFFHGSSVRMPQGEKWIVQIPQNVDLNITLEDLEANGIYYDLDYEDMETDPSLTMDIKVPEEFSGEYTSKYGYQSLY